MEIGKAYLIHGGDWHTFVGRLVGQSTPLIYDFEQVSKIWDTNQADVWGDLAADNSKADRKICEYRHFSGTVHLPVSIAAIEWSGKTPQEQGLPEQPQ